MADPVQSNRYLIHQAFFTIVKSVGESQDATAFYNPALPISMGSKAGTAVFLIDRGDTLIDQIGADPEKRACTFVIGVVMRRATPDALADALHFSIRYAIKTSIRGLLLGAGIRAAVIREEEVDASLKDMQTDGALLMSGYRVEYLQPYAAPFTA